MAKVLFGLTVCLAIALALGATSTTTEASLVRCPRQMCDPCQYGFLVDENGCETCECVPNPCLGVNCGFRSECRVSDWRDCIGDERPCRHFAAVCQDVVTTPSAPPPRDLPSIPEDEPFHGIPTDENGCRPVMCRMFCAFGWKRNDQGCEICACNRDPCESLDCEEGTACETHLDCHSGPSCRHEAQCIPLIGRLRTVTPQRQTTTRAPQQPGGMACPMYQCMMFCDFGFKIDENGCEICDCNSSPCDSLECGDGLTCKESNSVCGEDDHACQVGSCTLKPLCLVQRERAGEPMLGAAGRGRHTPGGGSLGNLGGRMLRSVHDAINALPPPSCDADGDFLPTQCNHVTGDCWCVDDRGLEVEGTRRNLREEGATPLDCPENRTTSLTGMVKLNHDIDDVQNHIDNLRELAHQKVSEWMVVAREYVVIVEMTPAEIHMLQVVFIVRTDEDAVHDLATSSVHLQHQAVQESLEITYQGHVLTPQTNSLAMHHRYLPAMPPTTVCESGFFYEHQAVFVSCIVGIVFFLVVVAALVKLVSARRKLGSSPMEQIMVEDDMPRYKKNLALGKSFSVGTGDEEKKVVLSDAEDMSRDVIA